MQTISNHNGKDLLIPSNWNVRSFADMQPINCAKCGKVLSFASLDDPHYSKRLYSFGGFPLVICSCCHFEEEDEDDGDE